MQLINKFIKSLSSVSMYIGYRCLLDNVDKNYRFYTIMLFFCSLMYHSNEQFGREKWSEILKKMDYIAITAISTFVFFKSNAAVYLYAPLVIKNELLKEIIYTLGSLKVLYLLDYQYKITLLITQGTGLYVYFLENGNICSAKSSLNKFIWHASQGAFVYLASLTCLI